MLKFPKIMQSVWVYVCHIMSEPTTSILHYVCRVYVSYRAQSGIVAE